jgi:thiamine kinase-like enzyme
MQNRQQHQPEVRAFLQKQFSSRHWEFTLPYGNGKETYFAHGNGNTYFVKLGARIANYQAMASIGLTPPVIATGFLEDETPLLVQPFITGRKPSRKDYRAYLEQIATIINRTHLSPEVRNVLLEASSNLYSVQGFQALTCVQKRWAQYKPQVPAIAEWVDESLSYLAQQIQRVQGAGLVASHNDICNANWLIASDGQIYLIDLDSMSMDDPACDIGAILWWYYPPRLRQRFLEIVGYANDEQFQNRMQVRMAIHCLSIIIPRSQSFDRFIPDIFSESLTDFRAILAGRENPQGYD